MSTFGTSLRRRHDLTMTSPDLRAASALFNTQVSESRTLNLNEVTIGGVTVQEQGPEFCQNRTDKCKCEEPAVGELRETFGGRQMYTAP